MENNKWLKKAIKLLQAVESNYGIIYFNNYFCHMEGDSEENYVLTIDLLDTKKVLGNVIDMIAVETKEHYQELKVNLDKFHQFNIEISESEFRHKIKIAGNELHEVDDRDRPMTVFEVRIDEYNAIRLCELCDGRINYEKYQGNAEANGKTRFSFSQNMSYEIFFINNMYQLKIGNNGYTKREVAKEIENDIDKEKALESLFNEMSKEVIDDVTKEPIEEREVVININKENFIKEETVKEKIPFEDYLLIKVAKYMYGDNWNSDVGLSRLKEANFLEEFKENNPEIFEDIFKTMLIEVRGYVKKIGKTSDF